MSWPPVKLTSCNIYDLINECELAEVMPQKARGRQSIPVRILFRSEFYYVTLFLLDNFNAVENRTFLAHFSFLDFLCDKIIGCRTCCIIIYW